MKIHSRQPTNIFIIIRGCDSGGELRVRSTRSKAEPCSTSVSPDFHINYYHVVKIHYTLTRRKGFYADLMKAYSIGLQMGQDWHVHTSIFTARGTPVA